MMGKLASDVANLRIEVYETLPETRNGDEGRGRVLRKGSCEEVGRSEPM